MRFVWPAGLGPGSSGELKEHKAEKEGKRSEKKTTAAAAGTAAEAAGLPDGAALPDLVWETMWQGKATKCTIDGLRTDGW